MIRRTPKCSSLRATCAMSQGARNWPFLTCRAAPVRAATARRPGAGPVGLVERALIDQAQLARPRHLDQGGRGLERVIAALDLTGPGDQHERPVVAQRERP